MTQQTGMLEKSATAGAVRELVRDLADPDRDVRWIAAYTLADIGEPAVGPLIEALDDGQSVVRLRAAWALGRIGDRRAVEPLIRTLRDGDWAVRWRAAQALGRLKDTRATDPLIHLIHDDSAEVRWRAVAALGRIGGIDSIEWLEHSLRDEDWRVRLTTVFVLATMEDDLADRMIAEALEDGHPSVKRAAVIVSERKKGAEAG